MGLPLLLLALGPLGLHLQEAAPELLFLGAVVILQLLLAAENFLFLLLIRAFHLAQALVEGGVAGGVLGLHLGLLRRQLDAALGEDVLDALLLLLPDVLFLQNELILKLLILCDELGFLLFVVGEDGLIALLE